MKTINVPGSFRRIAAYVIDIFIVNIFWIPVTLQIAAAWLNSRNAVIEWRLILICTVLGFCYRWFFYYFMGATLGKLMLGLRLVNRNDPEKELDLIQCFVRVLADHLSLFFGLSFQSLMFLRFDRTHLSDWIAETRVIQFTERSSPAKRRPALTFILFIYLFSSGFLNAYKLIKSSEFKASKLIISKTHFQR